MTKTPEELTAEWKAGKLEADKEYYIKITDDIVIIDFYTQQYDNSHYPLGLGFDLSSNKFIKKILAPVPTYDEYKAMQAAIQKGESAIDTNKRLCKKVKELEAELDEHRHYCCCSENEVMRLKLTEMKELLKECLPIVSAEIMTWQIRGGEESYKRGQNLLTRINAALGESEE